MPKRISGFFAAAFVLAVVSSCARDPSLIGIDNPETPVASVKAATKHKIFIATTRQATDVVGVFYSGERAPELGLASVTVSIPPNHEIGKLERPKDLPPEPDREFAVIDPTVYQTDTAFINEINRELALRTPENRKVLFFVHGYNNTASDSILRLAQFVEDTGYGGIPVLFSWASAAKATHYVYDLNSALTARPQFIKAADIIGRTRAVRYDLFAHSMGAFLAMEAIVQAELSGGFNPNNRLKTIMFAAPDIDVDLFRAQLSQIPDRNQNRHQDYYIFVSGDDRMLGFARTLSGGVNRVGRADAAELAEFGLKVIDLSQIRNSTSGSHSKFSGSPEVVQLIGQGLQTNSRFGTKSLSQLQELLGDLPIRVIYN